MSEQMHDKGYKRLLAKKKNFLNLLQNFVKESWVNDLSEEDLVLMNTEFVLKDFSDKEADIIYRATLKGKQKREVIFYCLLELQSKVDFTMPFRLLLYMVELMRRIFLDTDKKKRERKNFRLPVIIPIVLYNGTKEWTAVRSFKEYLQGYTYFDDNMIDFKYILLNVNQYTDESLQEINSLVASVFLLDKKQESQQLIDRLNIALHIFTTLSEDDKIDFKEWLEDILLQKVSKKEVVKKFMVHLEKGDVMDMTYGIGRFFDEMNEKVALADKKLKKVEQERKKELLEREKERETERLEREKLENEIKSLKKKLANQI